MCDNLVLVAQWEEVCLCLRWCLHYTPPAYALPCPCLVVIPAYPPASLLSIPPCQPQYPPTTHGSSRAFAILPSPSPLHCCCMTSVPLPFMPILLPSATPYRQRARHAFCRSAALPATHPRCARAAMARSAPRAKLALLCHSTATHTCLLPLSVLGISTTPHPHGIHTAFFFLLLFLLTAVCCMPATLFHSRWFLCCVTCFFLPCLFAKAHAHGC